jgi:magnesium transporter
MNFEITQDFVDKLEDCIQKQENDQIRLMLEELHYGDVAAVLYETDIYQAKYVLEVLDKDTSAEILSDFEEDFRKEVADLFSSEELAPYVDLMESDDAVDLLKELSIKKREEVIALMTDRQKARHIIHLLPYDEETAGGLMAKEFIKANLNWTITQCIEEIRRQAEQVDKIYSIYVVDDQGILLGRVSLKKIILSPDNAKIADIYEEEVVAVETYMSQKEVAEVMQRYDLEAIPVVNVRNKLLGRITIDDIVDVITEEAEYERQLMSGISNDVEEDDDLVTSVRARLPWLIIGMAGGLVAAQFMGLFEASIAAIPAMAFFTPLIAGTGGNVGIQSSAIILQSLATKAGLEINMWVRLLKVFLIALANGLILSGLVFAFNLVFGIELHLAMVVSIALMSVVLVASFTGTITPLILNRFGINPAVSSGPFITTANDILGIIVYFTAAKLLLL